MLALHVSDRMAWRLLLAWAAAAAPPGGGHAGPSPAPPYRHALEAAVLRDGALAPLPLPLYVTDTYMGGWNEFDLSAHPELDLSTKVFYAPDPAVARNYSTAAFGDRGFVRQRLALMQRSGLTPAVHIMPHRLIQRAANGSFVLQDWRDEGARVDGEFLTSVALFEALYKPLLEELRLPYMLIYDMWGFADFIPKGLDAATFKRLYWEELGYIHRSLGYTKPPRGGTDHHIRLKEYTAERTFSPAVYLFAGAGPEDRGMCDGDSLRMQLLLSLGRPNGTGVSPVTGEKLGLDKIFWIHWCECTVGRDTPADAPPPSDPSARCRQTCSPPTSERARNSRPGGRARGTPPTPTNSVRPCRCHGPLERSA